MRKLKEKYGDEYTTTEKQIYGYDLKETPKNYMGEMTEDTIVVNYVYKLKPTSVIVNYINEDGQEIANKEKITGKVFDKYVTTSKEIDEYELIKEPKNSKGKMEEESIIVDYIYKSKKEKLKNEETEVVNTGAQNNIANLIAINISSIITLSSLIFVKRKNKNE